MEISFELLTTLGILIATIINTLMLRKDAKQLAQIHILVNSRLSLALEEIAKLRKERDS